jgi:uncharacterized protein (DUF2236 family)
MSAESVRPTEVSRRYMGQWRFVPAMVRAIVLQTAHPVISAGVSDYSTFRPHLWRRFNNTIDSLLRMVYGDPDEQAREIARLQRMHTRIGGVDTQGRAYSAQDPQAQAWVLLTLFEAVLTMCELSGEPMPAAEQEQLYAEQLELARRFGVSDEHLPATVAEFHTYFATVVAKDLELTAATRVLLEEFVANMPRPEALASWRPLWNLLRSGAAGPGNAVIKSLLPAQYRERFGIDVGWYVLLFTRIMFTTAAVATRALPTSWTYMAYAAQKLAQTTSTRTANFFTDVLDQTGNGFVAWPDFAAMARQIAAQFDVDPATETELYTAFEAWWQQLATNAETTGDGQIELAEWVAAVEKMATAPGAGTDGLDRAIQAMFHAADINHDGRVCTEEYVTLFGGRADREQIMASISEFSTDGNGEISQQEFTVTLRNVIQGRRSSALIDNVLAST